MGETAAARVQGTAMRASLGDYVQLMKPRIIGLLLVSALGALLLGSDGNPDVVAAAGVLVGGTFMAGGAAAFNHALEADLDRRMRRTADRPVASGRVSAARAMMFGAACGVLAFATLLLLANWVAAALAMGGLLFYVLVYTLLLKRHTPQNIVIGGAAGSFPPLVGWAAATGTVGWPALLLALVIFLWTPPHFWALAIFRRRDYADAQVPMMPVVRGERRTKHEIVAYSVLTVAASLLLVWPRPAPGLGLVFALGVGVLGAALVVAAVSLYRETEAAEVPERPRAKRLFFVSLAYLGAFFLVLAVDARLV